MIEHKSEFVLTRDTPYLTLMGESVSRILENIECIIMALPWLDHHNKMIQNADRQK